MAVPSASGRPPGLRRSRARSVLLAVLALALVASVAWCVWLATQRGGADEEQQAREEVMQTSRTFMLRMGTYGPDQLDDNGRLSSYRTQVREVLTPKFRASFDKTVPVVDQLVAQGGVSRSAQVFSAGVTTIDADSATALVAGAFTDSYRIDGKSRPQEPVPFRLQVKLERIKGEWLVDDYSPVGGNEEQEGQQPQQPLDPGRGDGQ